MNAQNLVTPRTAKILVNVLLGTAIVTSYINFSQFQPKTLTRIEEVKGSYSDRITSMFPLPLDSENISTDIAFKQKQTIFSTKKSVEQVQKFYYTIFLSDKWNLETQHEAPTTHVYKYRKDKKEISITATSDENAKATLARIELRDL